MGPLAALRSFFVNWADFRSRSSRSEYWWATLMLYLLSFVGGFIVGLVAGFVFTAAGYGPEGYNQALLTLCIPFAIFTLVAGLALMVRRLHDIDRSGWWLLLYLTIIGAFVILYWTVCRGTDGENRYGADPLQRSL